VKGLEVTIVVITMFTVLVIAGVVAGLVVVGMEGRWADRAPKVGDHVARAARHLNGEENPPKKFVRIVESSLTR
jgi:uncharacterized membrane protein YagU involved in acid resistance